MSRLNELLQARPFLLIDGGMGQELIHRGISSTSPLWSAQALLDDPELVLAVHRDYVAAGADLLITNTYGTNGNRLREYGLGEQVGPMNRMAGELARKAADEARRPVLVAGSLPPLNGSYRPDDTLPYEEMLPLYIEMAEHLAEHVDLFLAETMSTAEEARAAAEAAARVAEGRGKQVWISWSLRDDDAARLRSGESVVEAVRYLEELPVEAMLFNCSSPEALTAAMPALAAVEERQGRPFGGYANGFVRIPGNWRFRDGVDELDARQDLGPDEYAAHAAYWYQAGARLIGGCCEVGPKHIAALAAWRDSLAGK
jgi:S-methylmethionine-dependent homocysteine/selenocysteine methylase